MFFCSGESQLKVITRRILSQNWRIDQLRSKTMNESTERNAIAPASAKVPNFNAKLSAREHKTYRENYAALRYKTSAHNYILSRHDKDLQKMEKFVEQNLL